jgi:NAD(P)-dependent dehydrogenase (short-subunit alcohol dehydrogenase family)
MTPNESVVVTGGARGIGRGIAEIMVRRGYHVVITDVDGEAARRTAEEIGAVAGLQQDVRDEGSHRKVAQEALSHGRLAAWFNNAGVGNDGALMELSSASVEHLVQVNLMGVIWGMRAALEAFGPEGGDVVNTASLSGHGPVPGLSVYAATKAAVVSLTMSVQVESPRNVRVHALCPDGVATAMVDAMKDDGRAKALVHSGGRLLSAEETAEAAVGLVGTTRVVRSLPGWRAGLMRFTSLTPSVSMRAEKLFLWEGRRRMRKQV